MSHQNTANSSTSVDRLVRRLFRLPARLLEVIVSSHDVSVPIEKSPVFVQVLPREFHDVVREYEVVDRMGVHLPDDSCGYQTIDDAIADLQAASFCFIKYVKPEDFLFVFSESFEFLALFLADLSRSLDFPYPGHYRHRSINEKKHAGCKEGSSNPRAIVLCKLIKTESLDDWFRTKEKDGRNECQCYEVSWREFQELKRSLRERSGHVVHESCVKVVDDERHRSPGRGKRH
jgi:hypothetical protein